MTSAPGQPSAPAEPLVTALDSQAGRAGLLAAFLAGLKDHSCLDTSSAARAYYSSDASVYRVPPTVVARPRSKAELIDVARAALSVGLPITGRGAGTSVCGNAVGAGLVIDMGRHLNHVLSIDAQTETAVVEPGVVQAELQQAAQPFGLRFGPDPGTADRCTIGGMIGNNACGPRALGYGRTADNIVSLEVLLGTGEIITLGAGADITAGPLPATSRIVGEHLGVIRTQFGTFSRQTSGYSLEHLLPEKGFAAERFFAGTEGTLGIVLQAKVKLVRDLPHKATIVLGYQDMASGADDMANLLEFKPTAAEGLDARIIDVVKRLKGDHLPRLPRGDGYLIIELVGDDANEVSERAQALVATALDGPLCLDGYVVSDPSQAQAIWRLRSDAAGYAGVSLERPAYPSWEDAAVPPDKLGAYLRDFEALLIRHNLHGLPYGHFGEGCVHCRIDFAFDQPGGTAAYRGFMSDAADLVAHYGGSMSGEHGDGRARSELLAKMYSSEALAVFAQIKKAWDPKGLLNPGNVVDPAQTDADIRVAATIYSPLRRQQPEFVRAVHQCNGTSKCLADATGTLGVMCPSYLATNDQYYSTRGRAVMLQEMVNGAIVRGWRAPELLRTLDLCLACKGCRRDCPSGIDMAALKSQVLEQAYRHRLRPVGHYSLGWLPRWGRLVTRLPGVGWLANQVFKVPGLGRALKSAAGIDRRRPVPKFRTTGSGAAAAAKALASADLSGRPKVAIWVDSFSDAFGELALPALARLLVAAGFMPSIITEKACCGLTWITTGQRDGARAQLLGALDVLAPIAASGVPIVGLEPSCLTVWRSDASELLPDDRRVPMVAKAMKTLAQLLETAPDWTPPSLAGVQVVAQPHCHQASVLGWEAEAALLKRTGAEVVTVGGCCGLAGNFGVEKGHYDISVKVYQHDLGPAIDSAGPQAVLLADGFSCRKQIADLAGRQAVTLAELLTR